MAPSTELRKWFDHDPAKWRQFEERYRREFREKRDPLMRLEQKSEEQTEEQTVTLVYGTRDEEHHEAVVLKSILEGHE